jgi:transcriptional regulator with XRE-family HTH domain
MSDKADSFLQGFADNLARLMESRGRSAAELADLSGLQQHRVEGFLVAKAEPGAIEILRLAKALDLTPGELVDDLPFGPDGDG